MLELPPADMASCVGGGQVPLLFYHQVDSGSSVKREAPYLSCTNANIHHLTLSQKDGKQKSATEYHLKEKVQLSWSSISAL